MASYLVTGGAGFIGSKVISHFIDLGHEVITIDNLTTGDVANIPKGAIFIKGDCHNAKVIKSLGSFKFDAILHIAGQSSGEISFEDPVYDLQTNTQSTLLLLDLALKSGCKNFIYASTMSIYGDQDEAYFDEKMAPSPISFYGVGKLASEHYMKIYQSFGISCTSLRLFNVYGPGQNLKNLKQGMISIFLAMAAASGEISVRGSGLRYRDFVHIDDVVNAFSACVRLRDSEYRVINICTGVKTTINEVLSIIQKYWPERLVVDFLNGTPGDQFGVVGNNTVAKEKLNWEPEVTVENGISSMVNWVLGSRS